MLRAALLDVCMRKMVYRKMKKNGTGKIKEKCDGYG
jgi:hypothetical protein